MASLRPTVGPASRGPLKGFPGAFGGMLRHRIGDHHRVSDMSATGLSDAATKVGEPADAVLNTAAWQGGRCAPLRPPASRAAERSADACPGRLFRPAFRLPARDCWSGSDPWKAGARV